MTAPQIISLGYHGCGARTVRVHHIPRVGETVRAWDYQVIKDGGKGSHQAMVVGKLGGSVGFIGKNAKDEQSDIGVSWLPEHNVDISKLIRVEYKGRGNGLILIDDDGNNVIISVDDIRKELRFDEVEPLIRDWKDAEVFMTQFEIPLDTALNGAKLAKELGMFTILNPSPAPAEPVGDLSYIDLLVPNETEAKVLLGLDLDTYADPDEMARALSEKFRVPAVLMTLGDAGALYYDKENLFHAAPIKVDAVDPIGAGDTFLGSFVFAHWVKGKSIEDALNWANHAAALGVSRPGSIPSFPTYEEVEDFIRLDQKGA